MNQSMSTMQCEGFFGVPNEQSGLSPDSCNTNCSCFVPSNEQEDRNSSRIFNYTHESVPIPLEEDPYGQPLVDQAEDVVCTIELNHDAQSYRLETKRKP